LFNSYMRSDWVWMTYTSETRSMYTVSNNFHQKQILAVCIIQQSLWLKLNTKYNPTSI